MSLPILHFLSSSSLAVFCLAMIIFLRNQLAKRKGPTAYPTKGFFGVPLHELSHLIVAVFCGHKIQSVKFYEPAADGSLGYVNHSYRLRWYSHITNLLISIAPLFGCTAAAWLVTKAVLPEVTTLISNYIATESIGVDFSVLTKRVGQIAMAIHLSPQNGYLVTLWGFFIYSVILHSVPSRVDLQNGAKGMATLFIFILAIGLCWPNLLEVLANIIENLNSLWFIVLLIHSFNFLIGYLVVNILKCFR